MNKSLDEATDVRPGEQLDLQLLTGFFSDLLETPVRITSLRQFPGGYSNLTYLVSLEGIGDYVLRCPPRGAKEIKGGHDVIREFNILHALVASGFREVSMPVSACLTDDLLGFPFYVMWRVEGVILRGNQAAQYKIDARQMRDLSLATADKLADLHAIDLHKSGLIGIGKPEGYVRRQVDGWYKRYQAAQTDDVPLMDELYVYLDQNMPAESAPTLLHNDYKYDNFVLDPEDLSQIKAILDWEMCSVGDPLMDLGTALAYWCEAGDSAFEKNFNLSWLPGNLTRAEFAARYAEKSGRDIRHLNYYFVFGLFKNAVIIQQIYARWKKGLTQDKRFAALGHGVQELSRKAMENVMKPGLGL